MNYNKTIADVSLELAKIYAKKGELEKTNLLKNYSINWNMRYGLYQQEKQNKKYLRYVSK